MRAKETIVCLTAARATTASDASLADALIRFAMIHVHQKHANMQAINPLDFFALRCDTILHLDHWTEGRVNSQSRLA
jgi:hypothetical protein